MEAIWNKAVLEHPPNATWRTDVQKFDAETFLRALDRVINDLESQDVLHNEAAILSRLIYRMKCKFRNDKGLKNMEKVNRALLNYLSMTLDREYKELKSYVQIESKYVILPSRQMLEYVLVRTQGFGKLMSRVERVAQCSANYFKARITLGHAWSISIIAYAVISRIWLLSRHLIKKSCIWYNHLYQYFKIFKSVGTPWLLEKDKLPSDLKSWLALPWIDKEIPEVLNNKDLQNIMFKLIIPQESNDNIPDREISCDITSQDKIKSHSNTDDVGEVISRDTLKLMRTEATETNKRTISDSKKRKICKTEECKEESTRIKGKGERENKKFKLLYENEILDKSTVKKRITIDNMVTISDLANILDEESYPGLDKLRWNMIKNNNKSLLNEINNCPDKKKQAILLKTAIRRIREWIN